METVAEIDKVMHPEDRGVVLSLTYGREFPTDPQGWADDLEKLQRLLEARFENMPVFWVKEFSGRPVPHFHLIAVLPAGVFARQYVREARRSWRMVAGDGSAANIRRGTHGEELTSWRRIRGYLGKSDPLPTEEATGKPAPTGRMWGIWRRKLLTIHYDSYPAASYLVRLRRVLRRLTRPKKGRQKLRGRGAAFTTMRVFLPYGEMLRLLEHLGVDTT